MGEKREYQAGTMEVALSKASRDLGVPMDALRYEALSDGRKGLFGIGHKDVVITVDVEESRRAASEPRPAEGPAAQRIGPVQGAFPEEKRQGGRPDAGLGESGDQERRPFGRRSFRGERPEDHRAAQAAHHASTSGVPGDGEAGARGGRSERGGPNRRGPVRSGQEGDRQDRGRGGRRGGRRSGGRHESEPGERRRGPSTPIVGEARDHEIGGARPYEALPSVDSPAGRALLELGRSLVERMGLALEARVVQQADHLILLMDGADERIAIGKGGEVLDSLQYIVNRMILKTPELGDQKVVLDSGGYRFRQEKLMIQRAQLEAEKVVESGEPSSLEPMNPYQRRVVHMALRDHEGIRTFSTGQGYLRRLTIAPASKG